MNPDGLRRLESQGPLLASALWGAAEQTFGEDGYGTGTFLAFGIHEGSVKAPTDEGFLFRVVVSEGGAGEIKLRGTLTSATGGEIEFRGLLLDGGSSGRVTIEHDIRSARQPSQTLSWAAPSRRQDP